jgi:UDP-glucose:(heptosyl)LPS alpha-1,3-glucosyltransferase
MHVAVIRQRYTPFGGAERFVEGALQALMARGVAVTLYTREWSASAQHGIRPRIVNPVYVGGWWRDAGFARAVCRALARDDVALVQSHERLACCDIFRAGDGVHAAWLDERMRHVSWLRRAGIRISPHHRYRLAAERRMYGSPRLRAVICNSRMVRDDIRTRFDVRDDRLHVIYNAVDSEAFAPKLRAERARVRAEHRISDQAVVYLHVGSGYERKGVQTAIDALAQLPPPAHLLVVGHDKHVARYATRARALGLADRVTLAGPRTDPRPYYGAADAFVLPTLYDPCPNAALEAMASALPIVTTTRCGAAEIALANDAGLVCDPADAGALAAQMRVLQDPSARTRMGGNGRDAMRPLNASAMTSRLIALYDELIATAAPNDRGTAAR